MPEEPIRSPAEADRLIARAIESVLDAIPDLPGGDPSLPELSPKAQPWAETAAPPGGDKRPLEAVLEEYSARVAAAPGAHAGHPGEPHPATLYLERLSPAGAQAPGKRSKRRWQGGGKRRGSRRRRGGGGETA